MSYRKVTYLSLSNCGAPPFPFAPPNNDFY